MATSFSRYLTCAFLGAMALFATAVERHVSYVIATLEDFPAPQMVRHQLTLAQWRTESGVGEGLSTGGLRAESNHFVQHSVRPAGILAT